MLSEPQRRKAILERRAEHARKVADATPSTTVGLELEALASLYDDTAQRLLARAEAQGDTRRSKWQDDDGIEAELMQYLRRKSDGFLRLSRETPDRKEAEDLRHLSAMFGAEVSRLRNIDVK